MAVTLRDFMHSGDVLTIEPTVTLGEAARAMRRRDVGAAVVYEGGDLVGIFTERDLLRAIADSRHPDQHHVRTYMTPNPITLPPDHLPSEAARIMAERKFRHIPVLEGGQLIGIVSIRDLVTAGMQIYSADAHVGSDFP
jgi:CBS domain-containing protein